MRYAFDLDGTIVDTRQAVLESYRAVGVEPPRDFFGKSWHEWLPSKRLHDAKNEAYKTMVVKYARPLPLLTMFKRVGGLIITGASRPAAEVVLSTVGVCTKDPGFMMLYTELTKEDKARVLNQYGEEGIVFDDTLEIVHYLKEHTRWTVCHVLW